MTFAYGANEKTARRVRAIVPKLIDGATTAMLVKERSSTNLAPGVFPVLAGWWRFSNRTAAAMLSLYEDGYTVEAAPLMRNLIGHAYALNWLVDNGEAGYRALVHESYESRRRLRENMEKVNWHVPDDLDIGEPPDLTPLTDLERKRHGTLRGQLSNFDNMVQAYGTPDMYPVYRNLSSYSHTTDMTAAAFVKDVEGNKVTVYESSHKDRLTDLCWMPVPLLQAALVMSPLIKGNPMRKLIREACRDLGLPDDLLPKRV
ncbi:hypothetical protein SRB5_52980 [Streptomyces sp. RB5]|uniref:Uncharacterized protein n=1 Tax=Streptomyces smaragdinus TaxID=2585196 RepID=A0A7K0CNQ4_9ACTN|nr:DUF5677 domain-containing protein [Streptomyces smaragdinus]MQY15120.1 hypothetical protein [Streptomyces smaragdinus]